MSSSCRYVFDGNTPCQQNTEAGFEYCREHIKTLKNVHIDGAPVPRLVTTRPREKGDHIIRYVGPIWPFPSWVQWRPIVFNYLDSKKPFQCTLRESKCAVRGCLSRIVLAHPYCPTHAKEILKVTIKKATHGLGLFAHDPKAKNENHVCFKHGDKVCPYLGERVSKDRIDKKYGSGKPYTLQVSTRGSKQHIDAACYRGYGGYANHAPGDEANVEYDCRDPSKPVLRAFSNIRHGEEILADYGSSYWSVESAETRTAELQEDDQEGTPPSLYETLQKLETANVTIIREKTRHASVPPRYYLQALQHIPAGTELVVTFTNTGELRRFLYHRTSQ